MRGTVRYRNCGAAAECMGPLGIETVLLLWSAWDLCVKKLRCCCGVHGTFGTNCAAAMECMGPGTYLVRLKVAPAKSVIFVIASRGSLAFAAIRIHFR